MTKVIERDALALLVVRLKSDQPSGKLNWHAWDEAPGNGTHCLPEDEGRGSIQPFKRMPQENAWSYFNAHVERLLFPPGNERGARWLCCPDDLHLDIAKRPGEPGRRARVDLLECLTTPLDPGCTFGLIHLSLLPAAESGAPDTLWWGRAIASTFGRMGISEFVLQRPDQIIRLDQKRPARSLTKELFGDPGDDLERSLYTALMVPECDDPVQRLALASHRATTNHLPTSSRDLEREERQTVRIADPTCLLLGRCAAFTLTEPLTVTYARNFRSYWTESIVFALLQQESLDGFQRRLADMDILRDSGVEVLRDDWLEFRNVLWWSQLSSSVIPQQLVSKLRNELGTERLFTDLEGDLITYSEHRQQVALTNLQIYGFPLVTLGTLATILALFEAPEKTRGLLIAILSLIAVSILLYLQVRRDRRWASLVRRYSTKLKARLGRP
ncbi:MAG TPA: hypothetical protein VNO20_04970 [Solirubrobacterales bacterium]|nr:hypothetical protein [Solirubrobacterales bacterium]